MAVTNHITLSSSPIRSAPVSSPGLPSPSQLFMSIAVRPSSGNTAVLTPQNTYTGITSTSNLPTQNMRNSANARFILKAKELLEVLEQKLPESAGEDQSNEAPAYQNRVRKSTCIGKLKTSPRLPVKKAEGKDKEEGRSGGKGRRKQSTKDEQTTIRETKITKPGVTAAGTKRRKAKVTDEALEGSGVERQRKTDNEKDASPAREGDSLGLTEALKRRKHWTPQKRPLEHTSQPGDKKGIRSILIPSESPNARDEAFGKLALGFSYAETAYPAVTNINAFKSASGESGTKKRKLDLMSGVLPASAKAPCVKRPRSPKKKPQTITDKATAPFAIENLTSTSIRNYFPTPSQDIHSRPVPGVQGRSAEEGKEGAPTRKTSKSSKVKKKTKQPVTVLPPESTMKTLKEQEVLFGTSSQLVREESPTHIREIQQAIKESETRVGSPTVSGQNDSQISLQSDVSNISSLKFATATRNLWSAAARDDAGSLLKVDVVDLVDTPQPSRSLAMEVGKLRATEAADAPVQSLNANVDDDWQSVDDKEKNVLPEEENPIPLSVAEAALRERPRSKKPTEKQGKRNELKASATDISLPEMPHYSGFSHADLNKEVVAFGFKPMKRREEIIPLLQRCWESSRSKNRIALQSLPPNLPGTLALAKDWPKEVSKPSTPTKLSTATKKKGRPAPKQGAATENGANIESVVPPKKPRGRPKKTFVAQASISSLQTETPAETNTNVDHVPPAPLPRRRTTPEATSLPATAATHGTEALFATITKAIKSYPPTHDARNLTWYEKMLIYDPVVLEDLANWLNNEGLGLVGCQDSISPALAKEWCESQSICCVWRENLKGGTRVRH
ncbi:MAG: hypothetical protein Q9184_000346 [Pyrenodesmia sp. 2 TL-2023]